MRAASARCHHTIPFRSRTALTQRTASSGVDAGGRLWCVALSKAKARLSSRESLKGVPRNSSPTGNPSSVKPAGTVIAGNASTDASRRLDSHIAPYGPDGSTCAALHR